MLIGFYGRVFFLYAPMMGFWGAFKFYLTWRYVQVTFFGGGGFGVGRLKYATAEYNLDRCTTFKNLLTEKILTLLPHSLYSDAWRVIGLSG